MSTDDAPFQFTPAWYALGIVTPGRLSVLRSIWQRGEDQSTEHYRYRAFHLFLTEHRPLSASLCTALYDLGANERDASMGESIMHEIAALPECPEDVLERARASGRKHLIKAATRKSDSQR